jgi:putative ABC transport system substrate-binding protein
VLSPVNPRTAPQFVAFEQRLRELGWTDGRNVTVDFRRPERTDELPAAAAELVRTGASVIVAAGPEPPLKAARQATTTVPIVMTAINYDPVERGYIASLARPGGNITGVFFRQLELGAKQLELLREALPRATHLAVLWDPQFSADQLPSIEAAARILKVGLQKIDVPPRYDLDAAFVKIKAARVTGVLVASSPVFFRERKRIAELALKHRLPSMGGGVDELGILLGYSPNLNALYRRAAEYVDKLLRGASPADLPVEQPSTVDLTINLKTARALGLTLPQVLLQRADRIIE